MINKKYLLIGLMIVIVSSIGCVESDINSAVNALPQVQQYLKEHPDAKITTIFVSKEEVEKMSQDINNQCDKTITPIDMYKVTMTDKGLKIISWFDATNKNLICSSTESINKDIPGTVQTTPTIIPKVTEIVATPTTIEPTANTPVSKSGNKILIEHYEKNVDKLTKYVLSDGPEYQYPNPGMTFLVINLKITDQGYPSVKINSYQWNLKISTKDNPNSYTEANKVYYGEKDGIECKETILENGGWALCKIPFEVPKNYGEYKVFWNDYSNKNIEWKYNPVTEVQNTNEQKYTSDPTPTPTYTSNPAPTLTYTSNPTPTTAVSSCDGSYPDVCIPSPPPDLNCNDISFKNFKVLQPDPHGFDRDKDGIGCET